MNSITLSTINNQQSTINNQLKTENAKPDEATWNNYTIVPIGCECIGAYILAKRFPEKLQDMRQSPYQGIVSANVDGIINDLDSKFEHHWDHLATMDPLLDMKLTTCFRKDFPSRTEMFINPDRRSAYVHDDCVDKQILIKKYQARIEWVKDKLEHAQHLFFMISCLGHPQNGNRGWTSLGSNQCVINPDQIARLSKVLDKICKHAHSLIVFAPGADISSNRDDVLLLKEHFGIENYWSMVSNKTIDYYGPTLDKIKTFIDNRLKETELATRKAEVVNKTAEQKDAQDDVPIEPLLDKLAA